MPIRMLLLQARKADDPMAGHERDCFVERTGLPRENLVPHDLCQAPPTLEQLRRFDAMTVGGSGEFYVSRGNLPHWEPFLDFLREAIARGHPTFASCFGFQAIAHALGAEFVHDPDRAEVGTFELTLTDRGVSDPLFAAMPRRFMAQMGHKDRADTFPETAWNLASSERCTYQALRVPDKPVWATQFHPELDRETNLDRFRRYFADYGPKDPAKVAEIEERFIESREASSLLQRFFQLVFDEPAR